MNRLARRNKLIGLALFGVVLVLLLSYLPAFRNDFLLTLSGTERLILDLLGIGLIALIIAALLSPLEALGWWAGWYGDRVKTTQFPGTVEDPVAADTKIGRYIVYLDGIGQSQYTYSPEAEEFLRKLGAALPDMVLIRGIMPYSVLNRSLTSDRPLSWFWQLVNWLRFKRSLGILGMLVNIRNVLIVAVSADGRYGPIYNQGMAQLIYNSLIAHGYKPGSRIPITLLGFSGGGEMSMGAAPLLKQVLDAPIEIISMAGVFCGHNNILRLEHIYHLVGDKDPVERLGPILFPKRWKLMFLSYWNRAKQRGAVTFISLGPVGHQTPGGVLDPHQTLPDGRTHLQQTLDWVVGILQGKLPTDRPIVTAKSSSYSLFQQGVFNQPQDYPVQQSLDLEHYCPIALWMGRLILPPSAQRQSINGVWFEVYHANADYADLVGQVVQLGWQDDPKVAAYVQTVTRDVHFSADAEYSLRQGKIVPERLNRWRLVDPLESLAGARRTDDMIVMLNGSVVVQASTPVDGENTPRLLIAQDPAQITGRFYAIVQFLAPVNGTGNGQIEGRLYRVRHFNKATRQFDGLEDIVWLPQVIPNENGLLPSSSKDIEQSPCNVNGWYIYGAKNHTGRFVVQAIAPRHLFSLQSDRDIVGRKPTIDYLKKESWSVNGVKGTINSVMLQTKATQAEVFQEGDRLLLNHVYGGIGGKMREPAAQGPVYFGHFAYGLAEVVREPLTDELRLEIQYFQVYTHNGDGLIACRHHWSHYMGDRQYGWLNLRPVRDIVIKLNGLTCDYVIDGVKKSFLDELIHQLQIMMARYRIGDGTGSTYVGPANNCAQDSNQALYAALQQMQKVAQNKCQMQAWMQTNPARANELKQLTQLGRALRRDLLPFGSARADWKEHEAVLGSSLEDDPLQQLLMGLASWRTMLPRVASDCLMRSFIHQGATLLVLRTNQVGGTNPDIEPIAPFSL
jgi:predicted Abi (CAAX) family protease